MQKGTLVLRARGAKAQRGVTVGPGHPEERVDGHGGLFFFVLERLRHADRQGGAACAVLARPK
jgi:hypothetical protein